MVNPGSVFGRWPAQTLRQNQVTLSHIHLSQRSVLGCQRSYKGRLSAGRRRGNQQIHSAGRGGVRGVLKKKMKTRGTRQRDSGGDRQEGVGGVGLQRSLMFGLIGVFRRRRRPLGPGFTILMAHIKTFGSGTRRGIQRFHFLPLLATSTLHFIFRLNALIKAQAAASPTNSLGEINYCFYFRCGALTVVWRPPSPHLSKKKRMEE